MIFPALPDRLVRRARGAVARLGRERFRESYFTTFWLPRDAQPLHALEEAVLALALKAGVRCAGMEWWIGRSYTTHVPVGFHFDLDVRGKGRVRHPLVSSVFFFSAVRGGQLAVTDQRTGRGGKPVPAQPGELAVVKPARNRYALFDGALFHGVLDARGQTPGRPLPGPRGRLRVTLVVNYWAERPSGVPTWRESGRYRALSGQPTLAPGR